MTPVDFLHKELENISKDFPQIHIKYEFNSIIHTHIVELLPVEEYRFNNALDDAWMPLSFKFCETFPEEEIAFISSDSELAIEVPTFEFNIPCANFDLIPSFFEKLAIGEFNYTFPTTMPVGAKAIGLSITDVLKSPKQDLLKEQDLSNIYQQAA